jgi:NitT/TauT family transport system permease protein
MINPSTAHRPYTNTWSRIYQRYENVILALGAMLAFLILWEILPAIGLANPFFTSSPSRILAAAGWLFAHGFWNDILVSLKEFVAGMGLAILFSIPLGLLLGWYRRLNAMFEPFVTMFNAMPRVALLPLIILWLGIGDVEKIAIIFVGSFFQLVLMVAVVAKNVHKDLLETAYTLGAKRFQVIRKVLLPASLPGIVDTLRIIVGWAWTYIIVAELVASASGIGYMIISSQRMLRTGNIIFGILTIGMLGLITDFFFKWLYNKLFPWME